MLTATPKTKNLRWDCILELPTQHRVPVSWIREHACVPIQLRTVNELLPPEMSSSEDIKELTTQILQYRRFKQTAKKQRQNGSWGGNMLGVAPIPAQGIKAVGTVAQYRHLIELGVPLDNRIYRFADRLFYRVLSRDDDPSLLFEYQKTASKSPELTLWARDLLREGVACALSRAGRVDDPRLRGVSNKIISGVSKFLRSELAEDPFVKKGSRYILHPDAKPPTVFSIAMLAFMPHLQRDRAGFVERLGNYLAKPAPDHSWSVQVGGKAIKPTYHVLGNPLETVDGGALKDIPWALHWIELLARLNLLEMSPNAQEILGRLLEDCDESGVWSPKNLRVVPRSNQSLVEYAFPLEFDERVKEHRQSDVTFRLALIAKLAGWTLEFV